MQKDNQIDDEAVKNLPPGVALSWGIVKQSQRGPKGELSIEKIVDAAIAIADKEGLSAMSMNRVASSLGFTAMSLYRYIPSKDDLLLLMQDAVSDISIPPEKESRDWRESMRDFVQACVNVYLKHPWFGDIPISGAPLTPNNLQAVDWLLREMRDFPLNDSEKMSIILLISGYARTVGMIQRDIEQVIQRGIDPKAVSGTEYSMALQQLVKPDRFPYLHPLIMSGVYTEDGQDESATVNDFDFGLERILDGIEHYLNKK